MRRSSVVAAVARSNNRESKVSLTGSVACAREEGGLGNARELEDGSIRRDCCVDLARASCDGRLSDWRWRLNLCHSCAYGAVASGLR